MTLRSRFHSRALAILACAWVCALGVGAAPARADVAYRSQTCKAQSFLVLGSFSMNKPAGVVSGDVMIATVRSSSFLAFTSTAPSGWTEVAAISDNSARLFYRVAGASEPGSYSFGSVIGVGATLVGTIVAFSGVDTGTPIRDTARTTGSGTAVSFGTVSSTRTGAMFYGNVAVGSAVSVPTWAAGMSESCDQNGGGITIANGYIAEGVGDATGLTSTLSGSGSWVAQSLLLQPSWPCVGGGLTLTQPGSISFPSTALNGSDRTATTTGTLTISDLTDTAVGWNLSATSTTFTNGAATLGTNATTITGLAITAGATNCVMPTTTSTAFPLTLPAAAVAPAATKIYSDSIGTGIGIANLAYTFALSLPANTRIGTYTSTWTFTLSSGP